MTRRLLALLLVTGLARPVAAEPSSILVLQAEGSGDAATRAQVDAAIIKLARSSNAQVTPGDITFADAAAAVGCQPHLPACKDEVLDMLGVEDVVYATLTPRAGGLEVHVHRVGAGGQTREARTMIASGQPPDQLAAIGPLFGLAATATAKPATAEPATAEPLPSDPAPGLPSVREPEPAPPQTSNAAEGQLHDLTRPRIDRLPVIGMVGGGTMVILGFMLWGQAGDIRDQINAAPTRTLPELQALAQLESRGDSYAAWGNLMFLGGAVLGGLSTYYFLKQRRRARATSARITPAVFDRGAGIALTIGGSP